MISRNAFALAAMSVVGTIIYISPVQGSITRHFDPPAQKWGAGNRGIDYGTSQNAQVVASAAGIVTFAGQVGGQLFVVVRHVDGIRTTYGYLSRVSVKVGDVVTQGQQVGTSSGSIHFGARTDDSSYIDPERLLHRTPRTHLVPAD